MKIIRSFLFISIFLVVSSPFATALSVKTLTFSQLVGLSQVILRGTLIEKKVGDDIYESGFIVVYYTFKVNECLKGTCEETLTFKQLAKGLPDYEVGRSYVLFLPEATEKTGLIAPVGIHQGRYLLEQAGGKWVIPALRQNARLVKDLRTEANNRSLNLPALTKTSTADDYDSFKAVILKMVKEGL